MVITIVMAMLLASTGAAHAATVRPGAGPFQVDVMLDEYETEQARRSYWAASVICWDAGITGKLLSFGACQSMVTVCAARAFYVRPPLRRMRAGITFAPGTAWCWKY